MIVAPALSPPMIVIGVILMIVGIFAELHDDKNPRPQPTEIITHYQIIIDGHPVQCERREDPVRGTVETAC